MPELIGRMELAVLTEEKIEAHSNHFATAFHQFCHDTRHALDYLLEAYIREFFKCTKSSLTSKDLSKRSTENKEVENSIPITFS